MAAMPQGRRCAQASFTPELFVTSATLQVLVHAQHLLLCRPAWSRYDGASTQAACLQGSGRRRSHMRSQEEHDR